MRPPPPPLGSRLRGNDPSAVFSNCLDCQASKGFQRTRCLSMALRMVRSLRMQVVMATFFGIPTSIKCGYRTSLVRG